MMNVSLCYPSELEAKGGMTGSDILTPSASSFEAYAEFMTVIKGISLALSSCFFLCVLMTIMCGEDIPFYCKLEPIRSCNLVKSVFSFFKHLRLKMCGFEFELHRVPNAFMERTFKMFNLMLL